LEKQDYSAVKEAENGFWEMNYPIIDTEMIFRDKETQDWLLFDRKGRWDSENLKHKQIF